MTDRARNKELRAAGMSAVVLLLFLLLAPTPLAHAEPGMGPFPFREGTARLSVFVGSASAFDRDYSVFGIGGGYFVSDGIELGLDAETWFGNSPRIEQVSPQLKFVANTAGLIKPYAGAFYRRTHIENFRGLDSVGARAGGYILSGRNVFFGVGLAGEQHLNCDRTVYASCSELFPEILIAVIF
jgi:hypothetical protein